MRSPNKQPQTLILTDRSAMRLAGLREQIERELAGSPLEQWQKDLCQWLTLNPMTPVGRQLLAAEALAGTAITSDELRRLKRQKAYVELNKRFRGEYEDEVGKAREKYVKMAGKAADIHDEMLDKVRADKDTRAAPPLLIPLLDRVWPKAVEGPVVATQVNVTLTASQQKSLDEPMLTVEVEEA